MANFEYVQFDKDAIYDFRDVILPNVWDELFTAEDFDEISAFGIGALDEDNPVGAVVFHFLPNEEVFISSIYVAENMRRQGVGRGLIDNLLAQSWSRLEPVTDLKENIVHFFVHTEYALPKEELNVFESFLRNIGFTDFAERDPVYLFDSSDIKWLDDEELDDNGVHNVQEALGEDTDDVNEVLRYMGMNLDIDNCYLYGDSENPKYVIFSEYAEDNDYLISSQAFDENLSSLEFKKTLKALSHKLREESESFTLIVSGEKNSNPEYWDELLIRGGEKVKRCEAGMYVYAD